jgi:hypothetical protein
LRQSTSARLKYEIAFPNAVVTTSSCEIRAESFAQLVHETPGAVNTRKRWLETNDDYCFALLLVSLFVPLRDTKIRLKDENTRGVIT